MNIILAAFLAGPVMLPQIDRRSLDLQARAEALQASAQSLPISGARNAGIAPRFDLVSMTTICRAAGRQADPARFINRLSVAYSLDRREAGLLRSSCAAYLAGQADAQRVNGNTY